MVAMNQPACPTSDHLQDFKVGRLPTDRFESLLQHLESCSVCRQQIETPGDTSDELVVGIKRSVNASDQLLSEPELHAMLFDGCQAIVVGSSALPVERLGPYRLIRPLGRGGMGAVYLAEHERLKRRCALKLLPRERVADPNWRGRFDREMQAVASLSHPNIVTASDAGDADGWHYLVMEYLDGLDLATIIRRLGPLDAGTTARIMADVCSALSAIHVAGLVHRDVKPSNIMLTRSGHVKLLDLGLVLDNRDLTDELRLTTIGQVLGTLIYAAPEQLTAHQTIDARTDLYGVGATLYQCLTGKPAHGGQQGIAPLVIDKTSREVVAVSESTSHVPPALDLLVQKLLHRDPERRPERADAVAEELRGFANQDSLGDLVKRAAKVADPSNMHGSLVAAPPVANTKALNSSNRWRGFAPIAAMVIPLAMAISGWVIYLETGEGTLRLQSELDAVAVTIEQSGDVVEALSVTTGEAITKLHAGQYVVTIRSPSDQVKLDEQKITISRGQETVVVVKQGAVKVDERTASRPSNGAVMYEGHDLDYWLNVVHNERQLGFRKDALVAVANLLELKDSELTQEIITIAKQMNVSFNGTNIYQVVLSPIITHQGLGPLIPELKGADENLLESMMLAISHAERRQPQFIADASEQELKTFHTSLRDAIQRLGDDAKPLPQARRLSLRCAMKLGEPLEAEPALRAHLTKLLKRTPMKGWMVAEELDAAIQIIGLEDISSDWLFFAIATIGMSTEQQEIQAEIAKRLSNDEARSATLNGFLLFLKVAVESASSNREYRPEYDFSLRRINLGLFRLLLEQMDNTPDSSVRVETSRFLERLISSEVRSEMPDDEYRKAISKSAAVLRQPYSGPTAKAGGELSKNEGYASRMIQRNDTNEDGVLTEDEMENMMIKPTAADMNADGQVTVREYADWLDSKSKR